MRRRCLERIARARLALAVRAVIAVRLDLLARAARLAGAARRGRVRRRCLERIARARLALPILRRRTIRRHALACATCFMRNTFGAFHMETIIARGVRANGRPGSRAVSTSSWCAVRAHTAVHAGRYLPANCRAAVSRAPVIVVVAIVARHRVCRALAMAVHRHRCVRRGGTNGCGASHSCVVRAVRVTGAALVRRCRRLERVRARAVFRSRAVQLRTSCALERRTRDDGRFPAVQHALVAQRWCRGDTL